MSTIAVLGAGPGLGLSMARRFGREEFSVALPARNPERLRILVKEPEQARMAAAGFSADVTDRPRSSARSTQRRPGSAETMCSSSRRRRTIRPWPARWRRSTRSM
jgi:NAD(P)-dependent dehydrogenase (short-subunit alcohol dehydrogenase family)